MKSLTVDLTLVFAVLSCRPYGIYLFSILMFNNNGGYHLRSYFVSGTMLNTYMPYLTETACRVVEDMCSLELGCLSLHPGLTHTLGSLECSLTSLCCNFPPSAAIYFYPKQSQNYTKVTGKVSIIFIYPCLETPFMFINLSIDIFYIKDMI